MSLRQAAANMIKQRFRLASQTFSSTCGGAATAIPLASRAKFDHGSKDCSWRMNYSHRDPRLWLFVTGNAAIFLGIHSNTVLAKDESVDPDNGTEGAEAVGLRKIEDGSVISNIHTSKWRIFTDKGRDFFLQGKLEEAEKLFLSALQEAKEGFGEREPHVASACNNLAELYRVNKAYNKAEPLYLEAISILEESFGPEDIRVGVAFHNLGQFYIAQRKLEEARTCYERALKIKGRVLGLNHSDYADTMYHLGTVLHLQGKEKDSEALIQDSIRILEDGGLGESMVCVKRMRSLAQMYTKSNRFAEAENVQRKILHIMELTKGWNSMETVITAEGLALILQSAGSLKDAEELLERCLDARKTLLPEDHIQIGANMLHIARVAMINSNQLKKMDTSKAIAELDKARDNLNESIRIARCSLDKSIKKNRKTKSDIGRSCRVPLVIMLQAFDALSLVAIAKQELQESKQDECSPNIEAEDALFRCISAYKEFVTEKSIAELPEVKAEYLKCLKHLISLNGGSSTQTSQQSTRVNLQDLGDEIKRLELELSLSRKRKI
ncbi:kinesin light chain 3 isoform X1 [Pyrus x bretschneideri]|uniref:kinesin light chain 3 isoform X1 n=1 Tax=Pyrus x bretschneideri TaxID=225117 RepID=UPI00202FD751|nr:kinesin light chain 3 isoform X1 [Pyrus x bretschneideri]XP_009370551.2 kinesin light chain 3 isoform X1 [Pyrus x bretschneideri]XP_009370552.2 kinesin light chain 3 isoform X1 [Pyrus x bretschneideri]